MNILENKKGVTGFFLYEGKEVLVYKDKMEFGNEKFPLKERENFECENGTLYKIVFDEDYINYNLFRFDGNSTSEDDNFRYRFKTFINSHKSVSYEFKGGIERVSLVNYGNESIFDFASEKKYVVLNIDTQREILLLCSKIKGLLFYTKTGERLWEYKVEEGREIHESGVMVVDDIVVIPSKEKGQAVLVEGYKLLTGEKVWEVDDKDCCNYCYSIGQNKMLYSLASFYCKDHTVELRLTQINPFTGEAEMYVIKEGDHWGYVRSLNETIYGNKLFYVNLNKAEGFSLGVVDLDSKELIEDMSLESDGFHVEKPIVTDDKIYVLILHDDKSLNELRIYENEFK